MSALFCPDLNPAFAPKKAVPFDAGGDTPKNSDGIATRDLNAFFQAAGIHRDFL